MKDLYKRLGVERTASAGELTQAISNLYGPDRADAEYILLDPARREVYDRSHRLLCTIGHLRGRLALGLRPFWSHGNHQDFTQPFVTRRSSDRIDPISVIGAVRHRFEDRAWSVNLFVLAIIMLIATLFAWWLTQSH